MSRLHAHMCSSCWRKLEPAILGPAPGLNEAALLRSIAMQLRRCKRKGCHSAAAQCTLAARLTSLRGLKQELGTGVYRLGVEWLKL